MSVTPLTPPESSRIADAVYAGLQSDDMDEFRALSANRLPPGFSPTGNLIKARTEQYETPRRVEYTGTYAIDEYGYVMAEVLPSEPLLVERVEDPDCPQPPHLRVAGDIRDLPDRFEFLLTDDGRSFQGEWHGAFEARREVYVGAGNFERGEWKRYGHVVEITGTRRFASADARRLQEIGDQVRPLR